MSGRMMQTYAVLELSPGAFDEISAKLQAAGYDEQSVVFERDGSVTLLDGIALSRQKSTLLAGLE